MDGLPDQPGRRRVYPANPGCHCHSSLAIARCPASQSFFNGCRFGCNPRRVSNGSTLVSDSPRVGRNFRYKGSVNGTTVLRPSFPPAICTTISVRSLADWAKCDPTNACARADATPRLNIAGIIIPADTTNNPSFIIALRVSFIVKPL